MLERARTSCAVWMSESPGLGELHDIVVIMDDSQWENLVEQLQLAFRLPPLRAKPDP